MVGQTLMTMNSRIDRIRKAAKEDRERWGDDGRKWRRRINCRKERKVRETK